LIHACIAGANAMTRKFFVWLHRWVGLLMALFLIIVGLTGSILAFKVDLERLLTPELFAAKPYPEAKQLDLATLADMAEKAEPRIRVGYFSISEDRVDVMVGPRTDPATGKPFDVGFHEMFMDPWTGRELGHGREGFYAKVIPLIYDLHTNLALGGLGGWALGIVALAWTIDCFYAIYLTFPVVLSRFFSKWLIAWTIKWPSSTYRLNFDFHRASGLWFAPLLFILAWSSVMFNLSGVYGWTTDKIFGLPPESGEVWLKTIHPSHPAENPKLNWHEALAKSQQYIDEIAKKDGITVTKPFGLAYLSNPGVYSYDVESSINISKGIWTGGLGVWIDGQTGELQRVFYPTEDAPGLAVGTWLYVLHFANLYGWLLYRILVCILGIIIATLSVTGIYIWWKKRNARRISQEKHARLAEEEMLA
jgi:uncharacterized iron-regulated membrane protein